MTSCRTKKQQKNWRVVDLLWTKRSRIMLLVTL